MIKLNHTVRLYLLIILLFCYFFSFNSSTSLWNFFYPVHQASRLALAVKPSKDGEGEVQHASSSELLLLQHEKEMQAIAMETITRKVEILEDRFKLFQEMAVGDNAYQNNVSNLKSWLNTMENRPDPLEGLSQSPSDTAKEEEEEEEEEDIVHNVEQGGTPASLRQELMEIFTKEHVEEIEDQSSPVEVVGDIIICNNKLKILAYIVNDQLHNVRDKIFTLDQDLKKMAKGVEFAMLRAKFADGSNEMVCIRRKISSYVMTP